MPSSSTTPPDAAEPVDTNPVDNLEGEPAPTPLIMIETTDEAGVCGPDGWCD